MNERELFEEWAYSNKWNIFRVRDMGIDRYVDDFVDGAWHGWQASANRQGYKLVPVEPDLKMARERYHLFTFDMHDSGGCLRMFNYKLIDEFETYQECIDKAVAIGCNINHINYEFRIYQTTNLKKSND